MAVIPVCNFRIRDADKGFMKSIYILAIILLGTSGLFAGTTIVDTAKAFSNWQKGTTLGAAEKFEEAIKHLKFAQQAYLHQAQWKRVVETSFQLVDVYQILDMKPESNALLDSIHQWIDQKTTLPDNAPLKFRWTLYHAEGLEDSGSRMRLLKQLEKEIMNDPDLIRKLGMDINRTLGMAYQEDEKFDSSLLYFEKALTLGKSGNRLAACGEICLDWAGSLRRIGDNEKAIQLTKLALDFFERTFGPIHTEVARCYNNIAVYLNDQGLHDQAEPYLNQALRIRTALYGRESNEYASILNNTAKTYLNLNKPIKAKNLIIETISILENLENPNPTFHVASYNTLAEVYDAMNNLEEAKVHYEKAVSLFEGYFPENKRVRFYYLDLANNARRRSNYGEALSYIQKTLGVAIPGVNPNDIYSNPALDDPSNYQTLQYLLQTKAMIWYQYYQQETNDTSDLKISIELYEMADYFASKNRTETRYQKTRETFSRRNLSIYEGGIEACFEMFTASSNSIYAEKAFHLMEKSKSLSLLESLLEANALHQSGLPSQLLEQERNFQDSIRYYRTQIMKVRNSGSDRLEQILTKRKINLDLQFDLFKRKLEKEFPAFYQSKYSHSFVNLHQLQNVLDSDQSVLEYFAGNKNIFILHISDKTFRFYRESKPEGFNLLVKDLNQSIRDYDPVSSLEDSSNHQAITAYIQSASALYTILIDPVKSELGKQVILIPDGTINSIPFGALLTGDPQDKTDFKNYPYLENEHLFSYNYSSTLRQQMLNAKAVSSSKLLAVAPEFTSKEVSDSTQQYNFRPLLFNQKEAENIARILPGTILSKEGATKQKFIEKASDYGIIHFATHATVDVTDADYSLLAFQDLADNEDSHLYLQELYNLHLPVQLVTLSACETNVGPVRAGEGVASLAKGFSYAGAKSIVTSLWEVSDAPAMEIMEHFYTYLKEKKPKDEALHLAKMDYLKQANPTLSHPFFWSTYISIGDRVPLKKEIKWFPYLLLAVFLLLSFIFGWRFFKS